MIMQSEEHVVPNALPRDVKWTDDPRLRAMSDVLETLGFKMYHTALRFEDDGQPHIPTYGLRLAADEFSRAAHLVFRESLPLAKPIKICLRSHIKTAAIGIKAFARSLDNDWNMVKMKCGAHCKLCSARCGVYLMAAIHDILVDVDQDVLDEGKSISVNVKDKEKMKSVFDRAVASMQDYTDHVLKNESFSGSAPYWDAYAEELEKIADYLYDML